MSRTGRMFAAAALVGGGILVGTVTAASAGSGNNDKILKAEVLVGVDAPFTGTTNPIRGVPGGGVPWVIDDADVELRANGRLKVETEGLVIPGRVPPNPAATFQTIVSCLTPDGVGGVATVNVSTGPYPADANGNSKVDTTVKLPKPCVAPIIFVANGVSGSWFAATGA